MQLISVLVLVGHVWINPLEVVVMNQTANYCEIHLKNELTVRITETCDSVSATVNAAIEKTKLGLFGVDIKR